MGEIAMKPLGSFAGKELKWQKPTKGDRTWKLVADGETVATLRREKPMGSLFTADAGGRRWTFKRVGFFRVRVTIRPEGSETEEAEFHPRWHGGGDLVFADGHRFDWSAKSFWRQEWAFTEGEANELLRYRCGFGMSRGLVTIAAPGARRRELPLLVTLGWYLILKMAEDAAGAAAAAAASG